MLCRAAVQVVEKITLPFLPATYSAEIVDYTPRSKRGDDYVYSHNRAVWEYVPRGCALLRVRAPASAGGKTYLRWALRANRKFTGHEVGTGCVLLS
jgi:hypothetical protein